MRTLGFLCMTLGVTVPATAKAEVASLALTSLRGAQPADESQPTSSPAPEGAQPTTAPATGATVTVQPQPQPTSSKAPPSTLQPTSSKAPASTTPIPEPEEPVEAAEEPQEGEGDDLTLEDEREQAAIDGAFHRHALGAHSGIVIIPTWLLSNWLASHTNALCRGATIGQFAADRGLARQDGCNYYVGLDYAFRFSRILDIQASVQYQRARVPEGLWLDKARYNGTAASLEAADYTEIDLHMMAMEVDFVARAPVVVTKDVELDIGGGGGLGLGVVFGGVYQTALGAQPEGFSNGTRDPSSCQTLGDLADLTRCTPRYDINEDGDMTPPDPSQLSQPNPDLFANCTSTECNEDDLRAFGYRQEQGGIPPVIPVVNLILSARLIIKDTVGITVNGGFNTGFYFGGGLQIFFGKSEQDETRKKPTGPEDDDEYEYEYVGGRTKKERREAAI
ncbi:MAG: hypothetical protein KC501_08990 [Myxococcales bacterium]|nr:hypothetical protein [Myxococcales bacterium]